MLQILWLTLQFHLKGIIAYNLSSFGASLVNGHSHIKNFNLSTDRRVNIIESAP